MGPLRGGVEVEQDREHHEHYAQRPQRPCQPCGGAALHSTDSSTLFHCPFCHNPTLQHYRLLNATATVTRTVVWAKVTNFVELRKDEVRRIHLPRTSVN